MTNKEKYESRRVFWAAVSVVVTGIMMIAAMSSGAGVSAGCETPTPVVTVTVPPVGESLIRNGWFCDGLGEWQTTSGTAWGLSETLPSRQDPNPGECMTAARWFHNSHPAGEWGRMEQVVDIGGASSLVLRYWYVSLSSGQGKVSVMDESRNLIYQGSWGGHLKTWAQTEEILVDPPNGVERVIVEISGTYLLDKGGVKITGVELWGVP
jgi:hypothetical protein